MAKNSNNYNIFEILAIISSMSLISSICYFWGFSNSSKLPIINLIKMDDLIISAIPWLIPSFILLGIAFILGIIDARVDNSTNHKPEKKKSKLRGFLSSNTFYLFIVLIVFSIPSFTRKSMSIVDYLLRFSPVVFVAFIEFGLITRKGKELIKLISLKYVFLILIFLYGGVFSFSQGLLTGKNGKGMFTNKQINLIVLTDNQESLKGIIYFSVGDCLLIYPNNDEKPILIQKNSVAKIAVYEKAVTESNNAPKKKDEKK